METYGSNWKLLVSYMARAQLTPTLTHVITHDPVTSGAKDDAMSKQECFLYKKTGMLFLRRWELLFHK